MGLRLYNDIYYPTTAAFRSAWEAGIEKSEPSSLRFDFLVLSLSDFLSIASSVQSPSTSRANGSEPTELEPSSPRTSLLLPPPFSPTDSDSELTRTPSTSSGWVSTHVFFVPPSSTLRVPPDPYSPDASRLADFSFYITFTRDTGMKLFDVKYKGDRIVYELGLNEAIAVSLSSVLFRFRLFDALLTSLRLSSSALSSSTTPETTPSSREPPTSTPST